MGCGCGTSHKHGATATVMDATGTRGVTATVRDGEPIKSSPSALMRLSGRLNGLFGPAMSPEEREKEHQRRQRMAEHAANDRAKHHLRHSWHVTRTKQHRTNAAMCATCPKVSADGMDCTALDEPVHVILTVRATDRTSVRGALLGEALACPLDRHARGSRCVVRWGGTLWYGVPEPLRWLIDWTLIYKKSRRPVASTLAGCGCAVSLLLMSSRRGFGWLNALSRLPQIRKDLAKWLLDRKRKSARMATCSKSPSSSPA
jgi:hypothetical protein